MNQSATEGKENTEAKRATEVRVDTVDYRSLAGGGQKQKNVQVIHQPNSSGNSTTSGGVLADAAAALETTLQSTKDAISGNSGTILCIKYDMKIL
ncbi:uncharacterized protein LOC115988564 [Quercus lobata]|uniref:Uncharacterized protein n=1 Tax=Quercus lobata TaxID=97700 RepID=A0A7N2LNS4_QUELO|nr:uncharacterized protein LOC115988564 [Quercus lobata]